MIPEQKVTKPSIWAILLLFVASFVLNAYYSIYFFKFHLWPSANRHGIRMDAHQIQINVGVKQPPNTQIEAMPRHDCVDIPANDLAFPMKHCWTRQEVQAIVQNMTTTFISVLQKNRIEFWIDQSTLLGSIVYEHILVPHATSVQLAFTRASLDTLREKSARLDFLSSQYVLTLEARSTGRFVDMKSGLFVELIAYDAIDVDDNLKPTVEPQICHTCSETNFTVPKDWIFPLSNCTLLNQSVPCPNESVNILLKLYKDLPCIHISGVHSIEQFSNDLMCWRHYQVQSMLRNLTISLAKMLDKHNIEYWLDSGTLLGQVRHQGLIPYDNDADFGITEASLKILSNLSIADAESFFPYALDVLDSPIHNFHMRDEYIPARWMDTRSGLYVDIFEYKYLNDGKELAPLASVCWHACSNCTDMGNSVKHFVVPRDWIHPLQRCQYENVSVSCPNKPKKYLTKLYGRNFLKPEKSDPVDSLDLFPYDSILLLSDK